MAKEELETLLINKAKRGDNAAFELLVLKYRQRIANVISRFIMTRAEVMDMTQEVFIKAFMALPNFHHKCSFYTWLYRIAINTTINQNITERHNAAHVGLSIEDAENFLEQDNLREAGSPEEILIYAEVQTLLLETMQQLPGELKQTLFLREINGLSYRSIAKRMHCPIGTVRSRLYRAREIIETHMQQQ